VGFKHFHSHVYTSTDMILFWWKKIALTIKRGKKNSWVPHSFQVIPDLFCLLVFGIDLFHIRSFSIDATHLLILLSHHGCN
jgi:hypothetical protein